jgi:hypothetical protein
MTLLWFVVCLFNDYMTIELYCNSVTDIFNHTVNFNWGQIQAEAKMGIQDQ